MLTKLLDAIITPGVWVFNPTGTTAEGLTQITPAGDTDPNQTSGYLTVHYRVTPGVMVKVRDGLFGFHRMERESCQRVMLINREGDVFRVDYLSEESNIRSFAKFHYYQHLRNETVKETYE